MLVSGSVGVSERRRATGTTVAGLLAALLALAVLRPPEAEVRKALVEFGWDEPDAAFVETHVRAMEAMPFDGVVLVARYPDASGRERAFHWGFFGRAAIPWTALEPSARALARTDFRRFRENFLRINVTPGDLDWWDDFAPVLHNARVAGRLVRLGRLRGVLFDVEQYQSPLFSYPHQPRRASRGFDAYAAQVRRRGREIVAALQSEAPGLVVFLTFGYRLAEWGPGDPASRPYALLRPFLDGLFEGATGSTRIVDGCEFSYPYHSPSEFEAAYRQIRSAPTAAPRAYSRRVLAGFGSWLDLDWRRLGWDPLHPERNPVTPERLERTVAAALAASDRYVWVYSENPRWWPPRKVPEAYVRALRRARAEAGLPER